MATKKMSDIVLPNYWDLLEDGIGEQLEHSRKMFLRGGRFSGKSFFAAHHIVISLLALAAVHKEGDPWACCLALRKYSNTLKTSVYAEIANAIINLGVEDKWQMLTNPMEIRLKGTKSVIKFANLNTAEDYGKVKSIKWPGGYCRFIWMEESDQFMNKHDVDQVLLSLYRGGDIFETIFTYNTPFSPSHWLNVGWNNDKAMLIGEDGELRAKKEKVYFKHVNLYDIPRGIVPEQVYDMAEAMREENLQEWKHVIMGETGDPATVVFPLLKAMRYQDVNWDAKENWHLNRGSNWKVCLGIDYGYKPDPTAFTVSIYNRLAKVLWVIDECVGTGWSEEGIYEHVKEVLLRKGRDIGKRLGLDINPASIINSEIDNRIIDGLRSKGLNIYPVKKMSGSRDISYQFLTGGYGDLKELWVDSEQCPTTWAEMIGAEFPRRDINGKEVIIQEWPSYMDHTIDSIRYRYNRLMGRQSSYWFKKDIIIIKNNIRRLINMKMNIDLEVIKQTNKVWGFEYMTALCMEEFAEVVQAINKVRRKRNDDNLDHLNEEIADCLICIEQLKDMGLVDDINIQKWIDYKQNRQQIRNKIKQNKKSSGDSL